MSAADRERLEARSSRELEEQRRYYEGQLEKGILDEPAKTRAQDLVILLDNILRERAYAKPPEVKFSERITEAGNTVSCMWDSVLGREIQECGYLIKGLEAENERLTDVNYHISGAYTKQVKREEAALKELAGVRAQLEAVKDLLMDWKGKSSKLDESQWNFFSEQLEAALGSGGKET